MQGLAGFLSGLLGSMGFGGGSVLLLYLTLYAHTQQPKAQGINLLLFLPVAAVAVFLYAKKKLIDWKIWKNTVIFGVFGAVLGAFLGTFLPIRLLKAAFGVLLIGIGAKELFSKKEKEANKQENVEKRVDKIGKKGYS